MGVYKTLMLLIYGGNVLWVLLIGNASQINCWWWWNWWNAFLRFVSIKSFPKPTYSTSASMVAHAHIEHLSIYEEDLQLFDLRVGTCDHPLGNHTCLLSWHSKTLCLYIQPHAVQKKKRFLPDQPVLHTCKELLPPSHFSFNVAFNAVFQKCYYAQY